MEDESRRRRQRRVRPTWKNNECADTAAHAQPHEPQCWSSAGTRSCAMSEHATVAEQSQSDSEQRNVARAPKIRRRRGTKLPCHRGTRDRMQS